MFGQLTYDPATHGNLPPAEILHLGAQVGYLSMFQFNLSPVGLFTRNAIDSLCLPTAVTEPSAEPAVRVHPNPARDFIRVSGAPELERATILDLTGKVVLEANGTDRIALTGLRNGAYLLRIEMANSALIHELFIKE